MREKGVERVALWTEEHIRGAHWGDRDSLIFQLSNHTTCQHLLHCLGMLRKETAVRVVAELSATEKAARTGLQMAARQAGIHHRLIGHNLLLLPHTANRVHGMILRLENQHSPQVAAHLGSWVTCRSNDWHWLPVSTLVKAPANKGNTHASPRTRGQRPTVMLHVHTQPPLTSIRWTGQ